MAKKKKRKKQKEEETYEAESWARAFRWRGLKQFLWEVARDNDLDLEITDHDKGWITETIYYKVSGTKKNIEAFEEEMAYAFD